MKALWRVSLGLLLAVVAAVSMASDYPNLEFPKDSAIPFYGDVTVDSVSMAIQKIHELNDGKRTDPIYMFIRTNGGDVIAGFELIDAMKASRRPVNTVALGLTASMGAVIHSYGAKRYMTPHATLMYHDFSLSTGDGTKVNITQQELKMVMDYMNEANSNISQRSGIPMADLFKHEADEWWVRSDEAFSNHLVDGVVNAPNYPLDVKF